jgi:hypothetical protein
MYRVPSSYVNLPCFFFYLSFLQIMSFYNYHCYELLCEFVDTFLLKLPMSIDADVALLTRGY